MPRRSAPLTIPRLSSLLPQTEKAYQKQVGVNVGYVSTRCVSRRPRSDPKASLSRLKAHARKHRSPRPSLPFRTRRFAASTKKKAPGKAGTRYYKNVGLGFKTPREAIEGACRSRGPARAFPSRESGERVSNRAFSLRARRGFSHPLVERRPRRSLPSHTSSLTFYSFSYTSSSLARKQNQARTSTRSAPSPATCPSAVASCLASSSPPR